MAWPVALTHAVLLASLAMAVEVVFTAATNRTQSSGWRLRGYTYVWMAPIYMAVYPGLCLVYPLVKTWGFVWRGTLYAGLILAAEWTSGWLLRLALGQAPWQADYREKRFAVHEVMRLDYAPAWFCAALLYERVFRVLRGLG